MCSILNVADFTYTCAADNKKRIVMAKKIKYDALSVDLSVRMCFFLLWVVQMASGGDFLKVVFFKERRDDKLWVEIWSLLIHDLNFITHPQHDEFIAPTLQLSAVHISQKNVFIITSLGREQTQQLLINKCVHSSHITVAFPSYSANKRRYKARKVGVAVWSSSCSYTYTHAFINKYVHKHEQAATRMKMKSYEDYEESLLLLRYAVRRGKLHAYKSRAHSAAAAVALFDTDFLVVLFFFVRLWFDVERSKNKRGMMMTMMTGKLWQKTLQLNMNFSNIKIQINCIHSDIPPGHYYTLKNSPANLLLAAPTVSLENETHTFPFTYANMFLLSLCTIFMPAAHSLSQSPRSLCTFLIYYSYITGIKRHDAKCFNVKNV
jgi:hypothetical protein